MIEQRWMLAGFPSYMGPPIVIAGPGIPKGEQIEVVAASERDRVARLANDYMERWQSAVNDREVLRARPDHSAPLLGLFAERDALRAEVERLREREQHFARVLGVTDGGRYRNDWDVKPTGLISTLESIRDEDPVVAVVDRCWAQRRAAAALAGGEQS